MNKHQEYIPVALDLTPIVPDLTASVGNLLWRISCWLKQYAYGAYCESLTHETNERIEESAVIALASWFGPLPVYVDHDADDICSLRLMEATALLSHRTVRITAFCSNPTGHMHLSTPDQDRRTAVLAEYPLFPDLLEAGHRYTLNELRKDVMECAERYRPSVLSGSPSPAEMIRRIARYTSNYGPGNVDSSRKEYRQSRWVQAGERVASLIKGGAQ